MGLNLVGNSRTKPRIREAVAAIFDVKNLRDDPGPAGNGNNDERERVDPAGVSFAPSLAGSFLPLMLETAELRHIHLLFFRVKARPRPDAICPPDRPGLAEYQKELRGYLENRGAILYDEGRDRDITEAYYGEGDHVSDAMMGRYTESFWKKIGPLLDRTKPSHIESAKP